MKTSDKIENIIPALLKAKKDFKPVYKRAENGHLKSKYVSLDDIIEAIGPALLENDLLLTQEATMKDNRLVVKTRIYHKSGEWVASEGVTMVALEVTPQKIGSAITYGKRYDLSALLAICADKDDDGVAASVTPEMPKPAVAVAQPVKNSLDELRKLAKDNDIQAGFFRQITGFSLNAELSAIDTLKARTKLDQYLREDAKTCPFTGEVKPKEDLPIDPAVQLAMQERAMIDEARARLRIMYTNLGLTSEQFERLTGLPYGKLTYEEMLQATEILTQYSKMSA